MLYSRSLLFIYFVCSGVCFIPPLPFPFSFHALEKAMATHSSVLAWRIPGTGEPGGLLSMGSHRVGHDGSNLAAAAAASLGNRKRKMRGRGGKEG